MAFLRCGFEWRLKVEQKKKEGKKKRKIKIESKLNRIGMLCSEVESSILELGECAIF